MLAVAACKFASAVRTSGRRRASSDGRPTGTRGGTGGTARGLCNSARSPFGGIPSNRLNALISCASCCSSDGICASVVLSWACALDTSNVVVTPPAARCCVSFKVSWAIRALSRAMRNSVCTPRNVM